MAIERVRADGARIREIVNEVTGHRGGITIEHPDGRIDAQVNPPTAEVAFERMGISMSEMQRRQYERLRSQGYSKEQALFLLHP